ncbi:MAG: primosomal protein N' [Myxococcales bacterium]|nr:primosomal protein N' [Myxococcales bacterium]
MTRKTPEPGGIADVAVGLPVPGTFHYSIPPRLRQRAAIGVRVQVPFGKRKIVTGFIVDLPVSSSRDELRELVDIPDPEPVFHAGQLPFYRFIAEYYFAPLGDVLRTALPAGLFKGTHPVLAITATGAKMLEGPLLEPLDRRILEALAGGEELTVAALGKRLNQDVNREAQRLVRWDFLEQRFRLAPLTARRKYETVWRLAPGQAPADAGAMLSHRAPKRESILAFLAAHGDWATLDQIRQNAADPRSSLNLLVSAGIVEATDREVYRSVGNGLTELAAGEVELTGEQQEAVKRVTADLRRRHYRPYCLYGVTGSGKTEVYLQLAKACLDLGRAVIVLVPEISLTPQFLGRFVKRLGPVVAPYHSGLSDGERYDQWRRMQKGEARVVVGARSALFAPFDQVGLIVVDEEHEHSFKQEDGVMYQARDLALKLGTLRQCPVVLGSATPSLETYAAARAGRYQLLELTNRPTGAPMPRVEIVDMRQEMADRRKRKKKDPAAEEEKAKDKPGRKQTSEGRVVSLALAQAIQETLAAKEQAILFLNRRGYSTYAFCLECGTVLQCPLCDISLTYHEKARELRCHYCDHAEPPPATCPNCAGVNLFYGGMGTERLEEEIAKLAPEARIARLDRDTVRGKNDLERILSGFARGEADLLVGTQMVAKGHDFPRVTLVGVVDADAALVLPDFRSAERAFALLSQVAGRAGRADLAGRVLIQTFQPDHYAIRAAVRHDFPGFFQEEAPRRQRLHYPPFSRLAVLKIVAPNPKIGVEACRLAMRAARTITDPADVPGAATLGPAPSLLHRVQGKYRWNLLIKAEKPSGLHLLCSRLTVILEKERFPAGTFRLDIDPVTVI